MTGIPMHPYTAVYPPLPAGYTAGTPLVVRGERISPMCGGDAGNKPFHMNDDVCSLELTIYEMRRIWGMSRCRAAAHLVPYQVHGNSVERDTPLAYTAADLARAAGLGLHSIRKLSHCWRRVPECRWKDYLDGKVGLETLKAEADDASKRARKVRKLFTGG